MHTRPRHDKSRYVPEEKEDGCITQKGEVFVCSFTVPSSFVGSICHARQDVYDFYLVIRA
jgi:hypothetical protein